TILRRRAFESSTGVNATVRYLASSSPSLVPVAKKADFNVWGCFNNSSGLKIPRQLKYETLQYAEIERMSLLALLSTEFEAFTEEPISQTNVKEKSIHFQYLVSTLARISSNLASQHDSSEGALTRKTSTALTESAESPLYHKQVQKTKSKTEEDLESEVKRAKNDDHTLGNPPVAHSIGERKRLAYGLGRHHHKGSQGQSRKRKATHINAPTFCWPLSLVETSVLRPGASGLCDVGYDVTIFVDTSYSAKV
ncbi:hypothetical protein D6D29_09738, partial [Aureobasidium pullulans]